MDRIIKKLLQWCVLKHRRCFINRLNFDVMDIILRYVDAHSLQALCQVSRLTYSWAIYSLYRNVHITSWNACLLLRTLIEVPSHRKLIKHAVIVVSEPYMWAPVLPVQTEIENLPHALIGSSNMNHRKQIGLLISRLPILLSLEIQYYSCNFATMNTFGCNGRTARCDSRPIREILSYGFYGITFNRVKRLSIQHCSLSQLQAILSLPALRHFKATITEGMVPELSLPGRASHITSLEINIRDYLSPTVSAIIHSCEALRKIRLVVAGFPTATDLNAQSFFEAAVVHQRSLQEIYYHNLHEVHGHSKQENVLQALSQFERLTCLSTSILPIADQSQIWTRLPRTLQYITLFDSKGFCADLIAPGGNLETLAADSSLLPDLIRFEMKTFLYPGDHGFMHRREDNRDTTYRSLQSRGISLEHTDWLDQSTSPA